MIGSRCPRGHGSWIPERARCPLCAGPVERVDVPEMGTLLAVTGAERPVAVVQLGEVAAPALLVGPAAARVQVQLDAQGLLVARAA